MIDIETTLRQHFEQRASAIDVRPDIEAVVDGHSEITVSETPSRSRGRLYVVLAAAAVLVALLAAGMFTLSRERSTPSDQPRDFSRRPLANGVIVVNASEAEGLVALDADGAGRVNDAPVRAGVWSPDGSRLAYVSGTTVSVFDTATDSSMDVGSCNTPPIGFDPCSVAWSNDGRMVATTTSSGIRVYDAISPSSVPVASITVDGSPDNLNWTADDRIVFTVRSHTADGINPARIDTINVDGTHERTIVGTSAGGQLFEKWSLDLSPDGKTLVWIDSATDQSDPTLVVLKLMMMSVDETAPRTVRELGRCFCNHSPAVTWSPDGKRLALVLVGTGLDEEPQDIAHSNLYVVDADGGNGKYLARASGVPTWQPLAP